MMAHRKTKRFDPEEDETSYFEQEFKTCRRCKQEYTGTCPLASSSCPMEQDDARAEDDEDEDDKDFDDVENLGEVLEKDEEADELTEEAGEEPPEGIGEDE